MAIHRMVLAVAALAFLAPVFVILTSPDVMTLSEASRAAPEVFAAIVVPMVLLVFARRLTLTSLRVFMAAEGRSPGRGRGLATVAATVGPLAVAGAAWVDFAAFIALISGALPELVALALLATVACLTWRYLGRIGRGAVRAVRGKRTEPPT